MYTIYAYVCKYVQTFVAGAYFTTYVIIILTSTFFFYLPKAEGLMKNSNIMVKLWLLKKIIYLFDTTCLI